jgi:hypothetical protein
MIRTTIFPGTGVMALEDNLTKLERCAPVKHTYFFTYILAILKTSFIPDNRRELLYH